VIAIINRPTITMPIFWKMLSPRPEYYVTARPSSKQPVMSASRSILSFNCFVSVVQSIARLQ